VVGDGADGGGGRCDRARRHQPSPGGIHYRPRAPYLIGVLGGVLAGQLVGQPLVQISDELLTGYPTTGLGRPQRDRRTELLDVVVLCAE
jgi:hypothetical protein